jgi:carboxyl-terminal processing protease
LRTTFAFLPFTCLAIASFVYGQSLRQSVSASPRPARLDNRVSSLPQSGIGGTASTDDFDPGDVPPDETFKEVLRYVRGDYVEKVEDEKKLGFGAVRSMLASLDDPKTRFLDPAQRRQFIDQMNGQYSGIGASLAVIKQRKGTGKTAIEQRRLAIAAPIPGGPAATSGLLSGDIITEIDGKWVIAYDPRLEYEPQSTESDDAPAGGRTTGGAESPKGLSLPKALELLSTSEGKVITLTVERPGTAQPLKVSVAAGRGTAEPAEFRQVDSRTGYLRITQFNDRATEQFSTALASARVSSLVVDLRDNVGGAVTSRKTGALGSALSLLGKLSGPGQVGTVLRRGNGSEPLNSVTVSTGRYKLAVIVNGGTSNIAELVAATLRERAGATVVGARTFGDSAYQKLVELRDGAGMTVTTGKLLTSKGMDFSGKGIVIDVPMSVGEPRSNDAAVLRATSG